MKKKPATEIKYIVCAVCSLSQSLTELVPRLWPFLKHNIMSVRRAALQTLLTLLSSNDPQVRLTSSTGLMGTQTTLCVDCFANHSSMNKDDVGQ